VSGGKTPIGGVLSDEAIYELVHSSELGELIVKATFDKASLQPASYDPRIAPDGLITPHGAKIKPGEDGPAKVVLQSGDAAMFSTIEMFRMPADFAGNITIKNRLATEGLMLLSGLLIDPGYGSDETVEDDPGCRLYLHVANIGKEPIILRPKDQIARVQFLHVCGGQSPSRRLIKASEWKTQEQPSLGFLTELKDIKEKVESTSNQVQYVVMLGYVVLGVTLIGVVVATVLAIVSK
jgi:deoxycytidine triphosphate deaminase